MFPNRINPPERSITFHYLLSRIYYNRIKYICLCFFPPRFRMVQCEIDWNEGVWSKNGSVYNVDLHWHLSNHPQPRYTRLLLMFFRRYTATDGPSERYVVRRRPWRWTGNFATDLPPPRFFCENNLHPTTPRRHNVMYIILVYYNMP